MTKGKEGIKPNGHTELTNGFAETDIKEAHAMSTEEKSAQIERVLGKFESICQEIDQWCNEFYGAKDPKEKRRLLESLLASHTLIMPRWTREVDALKAEYIRLQEAEPIGEHERYIRDAKQKLKDSIRASGKSKEEQERELKKSRIPVEGDGVISTESFDKIRALLEKILDAMEHLADLKIAYIINLNTAIAQRKVLVGLDGKPLSKDDFN